jgi:hypothetical protein
MNLNQNRAQLRGRELDDDCHKANISTNECGIKDNRKFCYGLEDACLLPKCRKCGAHVSKATCEDYKEVE